MAYKPNIPMATDAISQSQIDLQNNFGALKTLIDVNHVDFTNTADQGKHLKVTFPVQSVAPVFNVGEIGMYNLNYSFTTFNELFVTNSRGASYPMTASNVSAISNNGWTYLPSGALMVWGISSMNSATSTVTIPFNSVAGFPGFTVGISFPFFTVRASSGAPAFVTFGTATLTQFTAFKSTGTAAVSFGWFVIGQ